MTNKDKAKKFLELAGSGKVQEAYDRFIATDFVHHNQYFKGDRESLLQAMAEAHQTSPNLSFKVHRVYEDGNSVITHSQVIKADMEIAVVHIFRFSDDQVAELWDLGQVISKDSPNENGMF